MAQWGLRVRSIADGNFTAIVVAALLVTLLGAGLTVSAYGQEHTETESVTETVSSWSSSGQFFHHATVTDGSRAFPEGSTLSNRTTYFEPIAPTLNGTFSYNYTASEDGSLATTASITLVVHSVSETQGGNDTEIWRYEEPLAEAERTLSPGEAVRLSFDQNMSAIQREIDTIESQLGGTTGTPEAIFVADVALDGTRNGENVDRTRTYRLPVTFGSNQYQVNDTGAVTHDDSQTVTREVSTTVPAGPISAIGGPLLLAAGICGVGALRYGQHEGWFAFSAEEREYLAYRTQRSEFDEWITTATVPTESLGDGDGRIEVSSLSGLVDLAIDNNRRVIERAGTGEYLVFEEGRIYSYEPPDPQAVDGPLTDDGESPPPGDGTTQSTDFGDVIPMIGGDSAGKGSADEQSDESASTGTE